MLKHPQDTRLGVLGDGVMGFQQGGEHLPEGERERFGLLVQVERLHVPAGKQTLADIRLRFQAKDVGMTVIRDDPLVLGGSG